MAVSLAFAGTATTHVALAPACRPHNGWNGRLAALRRLGANAAPPLLPDAHLDAGVAMERGAWAP